MLKPYGLDMETIEIKFRSLKNDVKLVYFTRESDCNHCNEAKRFFEKVASVSRKIEFEVFNFAINLKKDWEYRIFAVPALAIMGEKDYGIRYYGYPQGTELYNFLDDVVYVSCGENTLPSVVSEKLQKLDEKVQLKIFVSSTCPYSLPVAKLGLKLAVANDNICVDIIDAIDFLEVSEKYDVRGIPMTVVNEKNGFYGALNVEEYVDNILKLA